MVIWGIVPAAGRGSRLRSSRPKQYLVIAGRMLIEHSLHALIAAGTLKKIVVCLADNDRYWRHSDYREHPQVASCLGGDTRAQSVRRGLSALSSIARSEDWVLSHDAARPCLSGEDLDLLFTELSQEEAGGLLVNPMTDTVKEGHANECLKTLDRSVLYRALTPQMFRYGHLCSAMDAAMRRGVELSDEAMAMELAGHKVRLVVSVRQNPKVSREDDLRMAESLLAGRDNANWPGN